jgi:hypothetical protein
MAGRFDFVLGARQFHDRVRQEAEEVPGPEPLGPLLHPERVTGDGAFAAAVICLSYLLCSLPFNINSHGFIALSNL